MSKAGQYTFKGITTQAKASLLLFLLNLRSYDFDSVTLEDENWEDFTLNFRSGKKIICESKDWSRPITAADVKAVLGRIESSADTINPDDEILIVCNSVSLQLKDSIKYLKYGLPDTLKNFQEQGFTDQQIELLNRLQFDEIAGRDIENETYALFYDMLHFWLPQRDMENEIDRILVKDIFAKSIKGATFTRADLNTRIDELRKHLIKNQAVRFSEGKVNLSSQLELLKNIAEGKESIDEIGGIDKSALTAQPEKTYYFLEHIKSKKIDLPTWSEIWPIFMKGNYTFTLLSVFENNLETKQKAQYALQFIIEQYENFSSPFRDGLFQEQSLRLAEKMVAQYEYLVNDILALAKKVLNLRGEEYKTLEARGDYDTERELVSKLLQNVFTIFIAKKKDSEIRELLNLINSHFNLVDDDGQFVMYTPHEIFWILRDYIAIDFEKNFPEVVKLLIGHYQSTVLYRRKFEGWDWAGSGISQSGSHFSITDRHFVIHTLKSALNDFYTRDKEAGWKFMTENCIARKETEVTRDKPDFLNRASIDVLLSEYKDGNNKKEAFEILADFIEMRKGIPHKADLIFQTVKGVDFAVEQKWELVEVSLNAYKRLPPNVFVEQITSDLAAKGHKKAIKVIQEWVKNPEYTKRKGIGELNITDSLFKLLNQDESVDQGLRILKEYLSSRAFQKELDTFDTYDVARAIALALKRKVEEALDILRDIAASETLTANQQIAISSSLNDIDENNHDLLSRVYSEFLSPTLKDLGSIKQIEKRFDLRYARELLVQFAEKLAKDKKFSESLELLKIFVNDSDPIIDNYPDDLEGSFNYHEKIKQGEDTSTISTVRGWVCWALVHFCVLESREFIPEVVALVDQLHDDENYYVRRMVCHSLTELARIRHTVMPNQRKDRFIRIEIAEKIEEIAFNMLESEENQKLKAVMIGLTHVFGYIRSLEENNAWKVVSTFQKSHFDEVVSEFAPVFIFFAEFRKDSFKDEQWKYLGKFDDIRFKQLLEDLLRTGSPDIKRRFSWEFWRLTKESAPDSSDIEGVLKYGKAFQLASKYLSMLAENYDHQTFENIYLFIKDNLDRKFEDCYSLWRTCLHREREFIQRNLTPGTLREMYWWPFYYNGTILEKLAKNGKNEEFLQSLEFLIEYPVDVYIGDIDKTIKYLQEFATTNKQVERIFDRLIKRNTKFYDDKEEWLKKGA